MSSHHRLSTSHGSNVFWIDGVEVEAWDGQTIMEAAQDAGIYIPRLCYDPALPPAGHCRLCSVDVGGRMQAACTTPAVHGMEVKSESLKVNDLRRSLLEMLFIEGNHHCPSCEASGRCKLQATAYRVGMVSPTFPMLFPKRELDASHPEVYLDRNRCIKCRTCARASQRLDGKDVFGFEGRGIDTRVGVNAADGLRDTDVSPDDRAIKMCPTGCLTVKRVGFDIPVGAREYDQQPIGSDIEAKRVNGRGRGNAKP